jgi:hypothetical protein
MMKKDINSGEDINQTPGVEKLATDKVLGLFIGSVLLRKNLRNLSEFIAQRPDVTSLDPVEIPQVIDILYHPVSGPLSEMSQWRFNDSPYRYLFMGADREFTNTNYALISKITNDIYDNYREYEQDKTGIIPMENIKLLYSLLDGTYGEVELCINPYIRKAWLENTIKIYEQFEGKDQSDLPGSLTPDYVREYLADLRKCFDSFIHSPDGMKISADKKVIPNSN